METDGGRTGLIKDTKVDKVSDLSSQDFEDYRASSSPVRINDYENFEQYLSATIEDVCKSKFPKIVLQEAETVITQPPPIIDENAENLRRKSPITVQEWVDHLPSKLKENDKDGEESSGSKESDHLSLGAEAIDLKRSLAAARLSREASVQSSSSLDSLLDSRRPDPVEVLLNLGFGGVPGVDLENCRIPKRFLVPSKCRGGDWNEFLRRELVQAQNFECTSLGFRGLLGPSHQRPSAIVANIMEKLRERTLPRQSTTPTTTTTQAKSKFSSVARRVLNETSVLNKLTRESSSVLSPDNRKFLDNQGKISPEVPRRKIIFGQKSFAFSNDGELVEIESSETSASSQTDDRKIKPSFQHKDSIISLCSTSSGDSDSDDTRSKSYSLGLSSDNSQTQQTPEELLKLRRSSLQRQSKIDMDDEDENMFNKSKFKLQRFVNCKCRHNCTCRQVENVSKQRITFNLPDTHVDDVDGDVLERQNSQSIIPQRFLSSVKKLPDKSRVLDANIRQELMLEIESLSRKIQFASSQDLSSILKQIQELKSRLH